MRDKLKYIIHKYIHIVLHTLQKDLWLQLQIHKDLPKNLSFLHKGLFTRNLFLARFSNSFKMG